MHNLRRFYYQNKKKIWQIILLIAFVIVIIQVLNGLTKISNKNNIQIYEQTYSKQEGNQNTNSITNVEITSNNSAISGEKISDSTIKETNDILDKFVNYCNNQEIDKAYSLLSRECKETLYSNEEEFKNKYVKNNFPVGTKKTAKIENWINNIYKVNFIEDIMATGNLNAIQTQDYITIVNENGEKKLNINSFIGKEKINATKAMENVEIIIISKTIFMDHEEYEIKVNNKTQNPILLDSLNSTKTLYLQDEKGTKHYAYTQEILNTDLKINSGFSSKINIKCHKKHSAITNIKQIVFSDLILNYNKYINGETEKINFIVEL